MAAPAHLRSLARACMHAIAPTRTHAVYAQLGVRVREESFQPDKEEEFEDAQGNVLSRRMYEDLRRQGLLEG